MQLHTVSVCDVKIMLFLIYKKFTNSKHSNIIRGKKYSNKYVDKITAVKYLNKQLISDNDIALIYDIIMYIIYKE